MTADGEVGSLLKAGRIEEAGEVLAGLDPKERDSAWVKIRKSEVAIQRALKSPTPSDDPGLAEAENLLNEVLAESPDDYRAMLLLGKVMGLQGRIVEGVKMLEKARKVEPDKAEAFFELAKIYLGVVEVEAAIKAVEMGLERDQANAEGHLLRGVIYFDYMKDSNEGLRSMREALKLDPRLPGGVETLSARLLNFAIHALHKRDFESVLQITDEVLEMNPDDLQALKLRGEVYYQIQEIGQGLADFERALDLDPGDDEVRGFFAKGLIKRGYQLLLLKERDEALSFFRRAVALHAPDVDVGVVSRILEDDEKRGSVGGEGPEKPDGRALFEEASACLEKGEAEKACALLKESLEILPDNPYAYHQLGLALDLLGKGQDAEKALLTALALGEKLDIKLPATYLKLAEIAIKDECFQEAEEYLNQHDNLFPDRVSDPLAISLRRLLLVK